MIAQGFAPILPPPVFVIEVFLSVLRRARPVAAAEPVHRHREKHQPCDHENTRRLSP
jgi:hypothetical protein